MENGQPNLTEPNQTKPGKDPGQSKDPGSVPRTGYFERSRTAATKRPSREVYLRYLQSPEWRRVRDAAIRHASWRCERCKGKRDLQVHHRTYARLGAEWPEDLEVLCAGCHGDHHYAEGQPQTIGLYLTLMESILSEERPAMIADLSEALKSRCAKLKIPYDRERIHRAIQIGSAKGKAVHFNTVVTQVPTWEDVAYREIGPDEAREMLREMGLRTRIKTMPQVRPLTYAETLKLRAAKMVAGEIEASIARCEALENAVTEPVVE